MIKMNRDDIIRMAHEADFWLVGMEPYQTQLERFAELVAELIVRECADLTRWQEYDMSSEQRIRLEIYQDIKRHFGVG
jgi:hypothetical protein